MKSERLAQLVVAPDNTIRATVECMNANAKGLVLVLDAAGHLVGTITDGDIRRAVLKGANLDASLQILFEERAKTPYPQPITAAAGTPHPELLHLMNENGIRGIPLLDPTGRVVDVAFMSELMKEYEIPLRAVVMAGGLGTRLLPLTSDLPKPMLPLGDKPILEHIVQQLQQSGIHHLKLSTHYMPEKIRDYFGDGSNFGIDIEYLNEDEPLGTAGALSMLEAANDEPVLLMNGDILTRVDFRAMRAFHTEHQADLTVGVRQYDFRVPYGVVDCDGVNVRKVDEKPVYNFLVNAGLYLLEPSAYRSIPRATRFDMTDLIRELTAAGRRVIAFPIVEYWLDIGQHADYAKAQEDMKTWGQQP